MAARAHDGITVILGNGIGTSRRTNQTIAHGKPVHPHKQHGCKAVVLQHEVPVFGQTIAQQFGQAMFQLNQQLSRIIVSGFQGAQALDEVVHRTIIGLGNSAPHDLDNQAKSDARILDGGKLLFQAVQPIIEPRPENREQSIQF